MLSPQVSLASLHPTATVSIRVVTMILLSRLLSGNMDRIASQAAIVHTSSITIKYLVWNKYASIRTGCTCRLKITFKCLTPGIRNYIYLNSHYSIDWQHNSKKNDMKYFYNILFCSFLINTRCHSNPNSKDGKIPYTAQIPLGINKEHKKLHLSSPRS